MLTDNGNEHHYNIKMLMGASVTVDNDAAGNFTATEVEGALAELAASNAADNDTDPTNEIQDGQRSNY